MRNKLLYIFVLFAQVNFAQYHGGIGDGYASAELDLTTSLTNISSFTFLEINISNQSLHLQNNSHEDILCIISDLQGRIIYYSCLKNEQQKLFVMQKGIYMLNAKNEKWIVSKKIMIY